MTFKELLDNELNEERNGGDFSDYHVEVGEDEGNVPHLHLIHKDDFRKNTAIRIDMPYYFLHGNKKYILNSKERKQFNSWIKSSKIDGQVTLNEKKEYPKSNWENLKNAWNIMYPGNKVTVLAMDYSTLSKDYKEA